MRDDLLFFLESLGLESSDDVLDLMQLRKIYKLLN